MIYTYCIAGICVGIADDTDNNCDFLTSFENFQTKNQQPHDILYRFVASSDCFQYLKSDFYIDPLSFHRTDNGLIYFLSDSGAAKLSASASAGWDVVEIAVSAAWPDQVALNLMTDIAFRTRLPDFSGFSLHASVVDMNGSAILFVGPSGIGKSTQAELWHERYNAPIINGDYGIIRQLDSAFHAFGSPWSGTSPYKVNRVCPVSAVFLLEQSEKNEIIKPDDEDVLQGFLPHCVLPYWHEPSLAAALDIIDIFLHAVPVYRLKCRPDFEAVEMAYAVLI